MGYWLIWNFYFTYAVLFHFAKIPCNPGWPQTLYVAEYDFELAILPPLSPECLDYRHVLPPLFYVVLGGGSNPELHVC